MKLPWKIDQLSITQKDILIIFVTALFLRTIFLLFMSTQYTSYIILYLLDDSQVYMGVARYLLNLNVAGGDYLLLSGPGYGFILAVFFKLFGFTSWPILILQIILSSLACVYIYRIGRIFFENRKISFIAAILSATSLTSISLSVAVLTDSLFYFLLVAALYLFLKGLNKGNWNYFIICGIFLGISTLIRSIGLFLPVILLFIAFVFPLKSSVLSRKSAMIRSIVASLLVIGVALPWAIKNKIEHQIFTVAETGPLAARNYLASKVIYEAESKKSLLELRDSMALPRQINGRPETARERHDHARAVVKDTFSKYPWTFIKVYFDNIIENVASLSMIHTLQLPQFRKQFEIYQDVLFTKGNRILILALTLIGVVLTMLEGRKRETLILASIYGYFAILSGVTFWQGSRIMFPGQLVWLMFFSVTLYQVGLAIAKFRLYFLNKYK